MEISCSMVRRLSEARYNQGNQLRSSYMPCRKCLHSPCTNQLTAVAIKCSLGSSTGWTGEAAVHGCTETYRGIGSQIYRSVQA